MDNKVRMMLDEGCTNEEMFYKVSDYILDKEEEEGYDKLDDHEKTFFMVGKMLMEVNNGGFDQYFSNTEGRYAKDTWGFLELIGEMHFSTLLDKAVRIISSAKTEDEKYEDFNNLDDEFYELESSQYEDLYDRCLGYLRR